MGAPTGRIFASLVLATVTMASAVPAQSVVPSIPVLIGIRTATHPTFDRIVLDLAGSPPQAGSRFVDELTRDGSGEVEWLAGAVFAGVQVTPAQAHDDAGHASYPGPQKFCARNLANVMAVAITGDYEGVLSVGVGMRTQTWIKVFTLHSPTRVVIDVGR